MEEDTVEARGACKRVQKETSIQLTSSRCAVSRGSHSLLRRLVAYVQEQAFTSRRRTRTEGSGISARDAKQGSSEDLE